jgi:hypothetical protein
MVITGLLQIMVALLQGKSSWYPLNRRMGGTQSRSVLFGEKNDLFLLPGKKNHESSVARPIA